MLVTIILTCYKQEKFIEETILSVVNQRYSNRELLIGDDSPDDNCRKIISKYTKKYPEKIHAWHHNPNKGIVDNMQFLLDQRNKESEYVAFLEGDDCLFPEYLEKKLEIFSKYKNIQLIYNELSTINESGKVIEKKILTHNNKNFCKKGKISYDKLISKIFYMSRSTLMVRSNIIGKYKISHEDFGSKTVLSDVYFFNQVAHNEDIYGISEPLVYYRIHGDSVTKNMQGSINYHLELIKYCEYLFQSGLIDRNYYKNESCRCLLAIVIVTMKKCFSMGFFKVICIFFEECIKSFKYRVREVFKRFG